MTVVTQHPEQLKGVLPFVHAPHNHCESGAVSNLFHFYGLELSEPMVFGLGAGLHFAHVSFFKVMGAPFLSYRFLPGTVFKHAAKVLGINIKMQSFLSPRKAQLALDAKLKEKVPVGLLTDMFYLEYMPEMFRFHFAAHNLVVYGKKDEQYYISDSILEVPVVLNASQLMKARFTKGLLSPRGKIYWIDKIPPKIDLNTAILNSISVVCKRMISENVIWSGYKGIQNLAKRIKDYPNRYGEEKASALLLNVVRMQEIVGTGGSGFRTIYANFLKESSVYLNSKELDDFANRLFVIAENWRHFAIMAAKSAKKKTISKEISYQESGDYLMDLAQQEKLFFSDLLNFQFPHHD